MDACVMLSPAITVAITVVKSRVGFVRNNPKIVATMLAAVLAAGHAWYGGAMPSVAHLAECIAQAMMGAVATHEFIVKPALSGVSIGEGA